MLCQGGGAGEVVLMVGGRAPGVGCCVVVVQGKAVLVVGGRLPGVGCCVVVVQRKAVLVVGGRAPGVGCFLGFGIRHQPGFSFVRE